MTIPADTPPFVRELCGTLAVHSQFVLHGNIRDLFLITPPGQSSPRVPLQNSSRSS
jgi:ATP-dependent Clp protease ATP-binding subunit ClpB